MKPAKICSIFFLFIVMFRPCFSQHNAGAGKYLRSYLTDSKSFITAPASWKSSDVEKAVILTGSTLFLMVNDERTKDFINRNRNEKVADFLQTGFEPFGNGVYTLPLLGGLYLGGMLSDNPYDKRMALTGVKSFVFAAGGATVLKAVFGRHRPGDDQPSDAFAFDGPFKGLDDNGSFVSRHSMVAFAVAATLSEGYRKQKKWVPWVAYSVASIVAFSRTYNNEHWVSDAFAGAGLGYVTGKMVFMLNKKYVNNIR